MKLKKIIGGSGKLGLHNFLAIAQNYRPWNEEESMRGRERERAGPKNLMHKA